MITILLLCILGWIASVLIYRPFIKEHLYTLQNLHLIFATLILFGIWGLIFFIIFVVKILLV